MRIETCRYNSLHVIRLDRQSLEEHHRVCPDQKIIRQDFWDEKPLIHGDLNFPQPQNLRSDNSSEDQDFEKKGMYVIMVKSSEEKLFLEPNNYMFRS